MTREQIEQAIRRGWIEHHIGNQVQTDEDVDRFNPLPSENFREGFIAGTEWRIDSVWHKFGEQPKQGKHILYVSESGYALVGGPCHIEEFEKTMMSLGVTRWAYIEDLLPERKEVWNEQR